MVIFGKGYSTPLKDQFCIFLKNSHTTKITMPFLSSLDNSLQDAYIIFQRVDNFEIAHKTYSIILVWGAVSPYAKTDVNTAILELNCSEH